MSSNATIALIIVGLLWLWGKQKWGMPLGEVSFEENIARGVIPEDFTASANDLDQVKRLGYIEESGVYEKAVELAYQKVLNQAQADEIVLWNEAQGWYRM